MIEREQIITLLEIHGMSVRSTDDEIRAVLSSAEYHSDEIENAILSLRTDPATASLADTKKQGLYKIFYSDQGLKPNEVSTLLGIDVEVSQLNLNSSTLRPKKSTFLINFLIIGLSTLFAVAALSYGMYANEIGPFNNSVVFSGK